MFKPTFVYARALPNTILIHLLSVNKTSLVFLDEGET
jgi:hypothetical protein